MTLRSELFVKGNAHQYFLNFLQCMRMWMQYTKLTMTDQVGMILFFGVSAISMTDNAYADIGVEGLTVRG